MIHFENRRIVITASPEAAIQRLDYFDGLLALDRADEIRRAIHKGRMFNRAAHRCHRPGADSEGPPRSGVPKPSWQMPTRRRRGPRPPKPSTTSPFLIMRGSLAAGPMKGAISFRSTQSRSPVASNDERSDTDVDFLQPNGLSAPLGIGGRSISRGASRSSVLEKCHAGFDYQ